LNVAYGDSVTVTLSEVVGKWFFLCFDKFLKFLWLFMHFGRDLVFFSLFNSSFEEKCTQFS